MIKLRRNRESAGPYHLAMRCPHRLRVLERPARVTGVAAVVLAALMAASCGGEGPEISMSGPTAGWASYGGDPGGTRYSPLTQIDRGNVEKLEVAWTYNTGEELGGWRVHAGHTGFADAVAETDEEAIDIVKRFLGYLPSHQNEAPPVVPVPGGSDEGCKGILDLFPESPAKVYDVRRIIEAFSDKGSFFELKARYGRSLCTALVRIAGQTVGIIANNPQFKGGAMDAQACTKATSFLVLCDSYNIPIVFLQDQPGFLIGPEAEKQGIIGKIINWMNAMLQTTVPKITIILRKSYGRGFINMGAANTVEEIAAWFSAEVSFMDPRSAVAVVHGVEEADDPARYRELLREMSRDGGAYDLAAVYGVKEVLDPRETRAYLIDMLDVHRARLTNGVGEHRLEAWPTSFV